MTRILLLLLSVPTLLVGWQRAVPGYRFEFPQDHFSHPAFQTEWWYYTGNVETAEGRRFGFELTFFRQGVPEQPTGDSPWDIDHLYLAHLALSDLEGNRFFKTERLNRAGPGLAGVAAEQGRIWNGNWEVRWLEPSEPLGRQRLRAIAEEFELEFELTPAKPPVIHGRDGVSQKGEGLGKASHYVSFTRLLVEGKIGLGGERHNVAGVAWMDHEFSTGSLGRGQVGWDWMSIQLEDNSELMLYRIRREDGSTDPHSSGTYVDAEGRAERLEWTDIQMAGGRTWRSAATSGVYPVAWRVAVPSLDIELECRTSLDTQEVVAERGGPSYWEGAVQFEGRRGGKTIRGVGYLEMTGYDKPLRIGFAEEPTE